MKSTEQWEALKEESHETFRAKGILTADPFHLIIEGHFGDIKENDGFRFALNIGQQKKYM